VGDISVWALIVNVVLVCIGWRINIKGAGDVQKVQFIRNELSQRMTSLQLLGVNYDEMSDLDDPLFPARLGGITKGLNRGFNAIYKTKKGIVPGADVTFDKIRSDFYADLGRLRQIYTLDTFEIPSPYETRKAIGHEYINRISASLDSVNFS
jgi:hypothetical protein